MGFSRRRRGKDGRPRYTAYYRDLRGREVSAGTFARKADADAGWQAAEVGRCRCEHCRHAVASYRVKRRRNGHDRPGQGHPVEVDPHLHASTFRTSVLRPALRAAGVDGVTFDGLRHAHASWLSPAARTSKW